MRWLVLTHALLDTIFYLVFEVIIYRPVKLKVKKNTECFMQAKHFQKP